MTPRAAPRCGENFERCNAQALACQSGEHATRYARLKLAGLDQAPCHFAVFAEPDPEQGHGLGRRTMPETTAYSAVMAVHTIWLAARAEGLGLGWVSILDPAAVAETLAVPPAGPSSAISAWAIRARRPRFPNSNAWGGSIGAARPRSGCSAETPPDTKTPPRGPRRRFA